MTMRLSISIEDEIGREARKLAEERSQSVSGFFAEAVETYIEELRRRMAAERLGRLADEMSPAADAVEKLHRARADHDRT